MIPELAFVIGVGTSLVETDWGNVGKVSSVVPTITASTLHKNTELKLTYGFDGSTDTSFNGLYQEEAKVSDVVTISLLRNVTITENLSAYIGYGYAWFNDHGKPLDSKGWVEKDTGHGYRLGVKYSVTKDIHLDLGISDLYHSDKHWERMNGETYTMMYLLTVNYNF